VGAEIFELQITCDTKYVRVCLIGFKDVLSYSQYLTCILPNSAICHNEQIIGDDLFSFFY